MNIIKTLLLIIFFTLITQRTKADDNKALIAAVDSLNHLSFFYLNQDIMLSRTYANKAIKMAEAIDYAGGKSDGLVNMSIYQHYCGQQDSALYFLDLALESVGDDVYRKSKVILNKGNIYYKSGNFPESFSLYSEAYNLSTENAFADVEASALLNLGLIYEHQGRAEKAIEYLFNALKKHKELNSRQNIILTLVNIANIYNEQTKYDKALEYFLEASDLLQGGYNKRLHANIFMNIGNLYLQLKDFDKALDYYRNGMAIYEELSDKQGMSGCLNNMGTIYSYKGDYKKSLDLHTHALQIKELIGDKRGAIHCLANISESWFSLNDNIKGEKAALEALSRANAIDYKEMIASVSKILYETYHKQNDYKKSFKYLLEYSELKDTLYSEKKEIIAEEVRTRYEVEQHESKLLLQKQRIDLLEQKKMGNMILFLGLVLITISVFTVIILAYRNRVNKKLIHAHQREKELTDELNYHDKELGDFALRISQKNDFLEVLRAKIKEVFAKAVNPEAKKLVTELGNLVSINLNIEKDREDFLKHSAQLDNSFVRKLEGLYPDLTEDDKRLSVYLRLNLSSKEISTLFNISAKSVNMKRYRLRKKMNVQQEISLFEFLNNI
ncbi:MAG: tetratricopeptide repeat protein [Bacteroidales bacterium]|jgi:tetratricopeptide (TPR) repeat protein|nr:tetratricopeptide repeat protein [Bacteroidales bacterium]